MNVAQHEKLQAATVAYIEAFTRMRGFAPSVRDVAAKFRITVHAALCRLRTLRRHGRVDWVDGLARTLRVLP